jgi:hypothetical protein
MAASDDRPPPLQEVWLSGGSHHGERWLAPLPPFELVIQPDAGDGLLAEEKYTYISDFAGDGLPVMQAVPAASATGTQHGGS